MEPDPNEYIKETITKYDLNEHYKAYLKQEYPEVASLEQICPNNANRRLFDKYRFIKTEIGFFAMLRWFFSHKEVPKDFYKKKSLNLLDVGCGHMFYAFPLKLFFEHAGGKKRETQVRGIDLKKSERHLNKARERLKRRGVKIDLEANSLENLPAGTYDIITCFNCNTESNPDFFFKYMHIHLANDGVLLMSFKLGKMELDQYREYIRNAGLNIQFETLNPFVDDVSIADIDHTYLCIATKEPL